MANFSFNKVILGGRLTADPELKQTQSGVVVVSFSIAVNRKFQTKDGEQQADFFNVTAWRGTAEFVSKYFKKGSSICIVGSIQNRTWTGTDGQKHYATDIVADDVTFVDSSKEANRGAAYTPDAYNVSSLSTPSATAPKLEEIKNDDDLPF